MGVDFANCDICNTIYCMNGGYWKCENDIHTMGMCCKDSELGTVCSMCENDKRDRKREKSRVAAARRRVKVRAAAKEKKHRETFTKFMVFDTKLVWKHLSNLDRVVIIGTDDILKQVALSVIENKGHQIMIFVNDVDDIPKSITVHPTTQNVGRDKPTILNPRNTKKIKI